MLPFLLAESSFQKCAFFPKFHGTDCENPAYIENYID